MNGMRTILIFNCARVSVDCDLLLRCLLLSSSSPVDLGSSQNHHGTVCPLSLMTVLANGIHINQRQVAPLNLLTFTGKLTKRFTQPNPIYCLEIGSMVVVKVNRSHEVG